MLNKKRIYDALWEMFHGCVNLPESWEFLLLSQIAGGHGLKSNDRTKKLEQTLTDSLKVSLTCLCLLMKPALLLNVLASIWDCLGLRHGNDTQFLRVFAHVHQGKQWCFSHLNTA